MEEPTIISASELFADDPSDLFLDVGLPEYSRRLTDKILAAFNHAYSVGELELAEKLRAILVEAETANEGSSLGRRSGLVQRQADHWVSFVEAREEFRNINGEAGADSGEISKALEKMKEAYKSWSLC